MACLICGKSTKHPGKCKYNYLIKACGNWVPAQQEQIYFSDNMKIFHLCNNLHHVQKGLYSLRVNPYKVNKVNPYKATKVKMSSLPQEKVPVLNIEGRYHLAIAAFKVRKEKNKSQISFKH